MRDHTADVITCFKCQIDCSWGFGATGAQNLYFPLTLIVALTTVTTSSLIVNILLYIVQIHDTADRAFINDRRIVRAVNMSSHDVIWALLYRNNAA